MDSEREGRPPSAELNQVYNNMLDIVANAFGMSDEERRIVPETYMLHPLYKQVETKEEFYFMNFCKRTPIEPYMFPPGTLSGEDIKHLQTQLNIKTYKNLVDFVESEHANATKYQKLCKLVKDRGCVWTSTNGHGLKNLPDTAHYDDFGVQFTGQIHWSINQN